MGELSTVGALYENVMTDPEYTVDVRVKSRMADPKTVNEVAGFGTPSTLISKLDSVGGFAASTLHAQIQVIFPLL